MQKFQDSEDYRFFCEERLPNPYPLFDRMRLEEPVHWSERMKVWLLTRYDDISVALRDPRLSSNRQTMYEQALPEAMREQVRPLFEHLKNWIIVLDPPEHTRLRRLINLAFTPRLLDALKPRIRNMAETYLSSVPAREAFDFKQHFSLRLSVSVIGEMLGIPEEQRRVFQQTNQALISFITRGGSTLRDAALEANAAILKLTSLFSSLIDLRRREPRNDLISSLVRADLVGERLSNETILALCVILFSAGHETTASSITSGLHFLLEHPLEFEKLRNDPEGCLPTFIEEVFRYESAATRGIRLPKQDLVIRGQLIKASQPVVLLLNAANHDPGQFADPHIFNLTRSPNEHLAFGSGRHICIGAPLARIEMDAAFRAILKIMPRPRLADAVVVWRPVMGIRSIERLPVHAGP